MDFYFGYISRHESGNLHLWKDSEHAVLFLPSVLRKVPGPGSCDVHGSGYLVLRQNTATCATLMNIDSFFKYDGT